MDRAENGNRQPGRLWTDQGGGEFGTNCRFYFRSNAMRDTEPIRWDTLYAALYGLLCGVGAAGILNIWWEG